MTDLSKFEDEIYAMKIEYLLGAFEYDLQAKANAAIGMMLERVDELVATGEPITEKQLEKATAQLNEVLSTELGGAMVDTQAALREVAAEQGEVVAVAPFFTAGTLMRQAEMDGTTMAEWFRRASPSPWMRGLMDEIQRGIEAGWERHRSATEQATRRLAATAIERGCGRTAPRRCLTTGPPANLGTSPARMSAPASRCNSRDGEIFSGASNGPPEHPRCRCVAAPANTG